MFKLTSNVSKNKTQEPIGILHEDELENTSNETENNLPDMFSQPKQLAIKERGNSKTKIRSDEFTKRSEERNLLIKKIQEQNEKLLKREADNFDEIDMFFKTLAMMVKKFPNAGKIEAKVKMFSLITELEQKYSNLKLPNNPLTIQPLNTYEYLTENNIQPSESDHFSSSTAASANS